MKRRSRTGNKKLPSNVFAVGEGSSFPHAFLFFSPDLAMHDMPPPASSPTSPPSAAFTLSGLHWPRHLRRQIQPPCRQIRPPISIAATAFHGPGRHRLPPPWSLSPVPRRGNSPSSSLVPSDLEYLCLGLAIFCRIRNGAGGLEMIWPSPSTHFQI